MRVIHLGAALCAMAVAGCNPLGPDWEINCPTTYVFSIDAGDRQTGTVGDASPIRLAVSAHLPSGLFCPGGGFPNAQVVWSIETGGGSIAPVPADIPTDIRHFAIWTLGPAVGRQTVRATWMNSGDTTAPFVIFEATAANPQ